MNLLFDRRLTDKVVWVVFLGSNWNYKCECEKPVSHDTIEPNFDSVKFNTLTQKWMCFFMMKMCVCDLRIVWVTFDRPDSKILWKLYMYLEVDHTNVMQSYLSQTNTLHIELIMLEQFNEYQTENHRTNKNRSKSSIFCPISISLFIILL